MLIIGYCMGILDLNDAVPDHSSFSLLQEPAWPSPRERSSPAGLRSGCSCLHGSRPGQGRRLCRRCQHHNRRRQPPSPHHAGRGRLVEAGAADAGREGLSGGARSHSTGSGPQGARGALAFRSRRRLDRQGASAGAVRIRAELSDRYGQRDHRRCRGDARPGL